MDLKEKVEYGMDVRVCDICQKVQEATTRFYLPNILLSKKHEECLYKHQIVDLCLHCSNTVLTVALLAATNNSVEASRLVLQAIETVQTTNITMPWRKI